MSLENAEVIDFVALGADGSTVTLYLVATEPWRTEKQSLLLQAKLRNYVAFAADGQLLKDYPSVAGLRKLIDIRTTYPLPDIEQRLVEFAREHWCAPEEITLLTSSGP